jgi:hypothetical protein
MTTGKVIAAKKIAHATNAKGVCLSVKKVVIAEASKMLNKAKMTSNFFILRFLLF